MAKKVVEELVDDLDGTPADHTVRIGWDNQWRELELSEKNLAALSKGFDPFWDAGRTVKNGGTTTRRARPSNSNTTKRGSGPAGYDRSAFKSWVMANNVKLGRGRPPRQLVDRFLAEADAK